jgi:hypothetical protein
VNPPHMRLRRGQRRTITSVVFNRTFFDAAWIFLEGFSSY